MRVPMTAGEQLAAARDAGHQLHARDFKQNGHLKYRVWCSCGWSAGGGRSRKKAHAAMALHLGKAIADFDPRAAAEARSAEPRRLDSPNDQGTEGNGEQSATVLAPSSKASSRRVG